MDNDDNYVYQKEIRNSVLEMQKEIAYLKKEAKTQKWVFVFKMILFVFGALMILILGDTQNSKLLDIDDRIFKLAEVLARVDTKETYIDMKDRYFS